MYRKTHITIKECPLNPDIPLVDCKQCPYHEGYSKSYKRVDCSNETELEVKLKPEPSKDKEYDGEW